MSNKVIIFGTESNAELAYYYLQNDSSFDVIGFSCHSNFIKEKSFCNLPVIPFENIDKEYSIKSYRFFCPVAPSKMNRNREKIFNEVKAKGYKMISYIHSSVNVNNAVIGENCFIFENNTIQPFVKIGDNVIMWSGNHIGHHSIIDSHVMFTSHVVLSGKCIVHSNTFFGVNSTIRDGLTIAKGTFIAMGSVIVKNTEEWSFYKGNPALKSKRSTILL